MAKRVRAGASYVYVGDPLPCLAHAVPQFGEIVKVVNLPGGRSSGALRNVQGANGDIYFLNITTLATQREYNTYLGSF